jgi:hypothetical protein
MDVLARLAVIGSFPLVLIAAGCTSQAEGERCTANPDCQTDFFCLQIPPTYGVCCPNSGQSSVALCNPGVTVPDSGTGEPDASADTTSSEAAVEEAAPEPGNETGNDGSADAGTE